jgi:hypothetical protein
MAVPFPNEQPLSTHDTIDLTEAGFFSQFEEDLQDTPIGANQSKRDYEFRSAGPNGSILIAKPTKSGNLWATEITAGSPNHGQWIEKAQYDPATGGIDDSQTPQAAAPVVAPGTCPSCGMTGATGKFCHNCAAPLPTGPVPIPSHQGIAGLAGLLPGVGQVVAVGPAPVPTAGQLAPGQSPSAGAGAQAPIAHSNPNRMEGKPKKEVVVPEGMSKSKSTGFEDALDALLAGAQDDQPAGGQS